MPPDAWRPPILRGDEMMRYFSYVLWPRLGWFLLHAIAFVLLFLLGYTMKF
jgi:hypothetical protein